MWWSRNFLFPSATASVSLKVGVAENDGDGRDEFQFDFNQRVADVARVQDVVHARKNLLHARVEETVRV